MNLGDGLKLETEFLDGRTKLILSPHEHKSKISVKMRSKSKIAKYPLKMKQMGHILKPTQNTCIESENILQKKIIGSETLQAKGEKSRMTFSPTQDLCKQCADEDCLHIQKEISPGNTTNMCLVVKQKPCKKPITPESVNSGFVCLTHEQLQQILMTINQGNGVITENEKEEETSQGSLHLNNIPIQPKDENIMGLLQRNEATSSVPEEHQHVFGREQEACQQCGQEVTIENEWRPADIFSTLGERERDRSLLEAKRAQWKKRSR